MASNAVEQSPVALALDARSAALLELLPNAAAATRFKRVVIQALAKNPDLLACTPDSVVTSVFEAAAMGLEPTGAVGGAHLVPFNVNVGTQQSPRWEKRAQLIPDYRGVVRMVTRPKRSGAPADVLTIEARAVKEGDEFAYELGAGEPRIHHVPTLAPDRSAKPTTHVYAVARLRSGASQVDVMDRAEIEKVRQRGRKKGISPWDTDWDEMAKKTVVKRLAKLLPVEPEVRSILAREDELAEPEPSAAPALATHAPRTRQLAARLRPQAAPAADPVPVAPEPVEAFAGAPGPSVAGDDGATAGPLTGEEFVAVLRDHGINDGAVVRAVKDELFPGDEQLTDEARGRLAAEVIRRTSED
jgi:recombination protein RecT